MSRLIWLYLYLFDFRVQFVSLNGEHAHITVKNENLIEISVGIQELVLAANVTMDYTR